MREIQQRGIIWSRPPRKGGEGGNEAKGAARWVGGWDTPELTPTCHQRRTLEAPWLDTRGGAVHSAIPPAPSHRAGRGGVGRPAGPGPCPDRGAQSANRHCATHGRDGVATARPCPRASCAPAGHLPKRVVARIRHHEMARPTQALCGYSQLPSCRIKGEFSLV